MKTLIVLPARFGATRFPGKVLAPLRGKPVVQWCYEAALNAKAGPVLVATEDQKVVDAVRDFGGEAVLTSEACRSGTDRVYEAAKGRKADIVVNVQADEPLIDTATIKAAIEALKKDKGASIGTAAAPVRDMTQVTNPNTVKVVLDNKGRALYFTRCPIPYLRNPGNGTPTHLQHIGIYSFRRKALERFVKLPPGRLEQLESLEQLRAMENGMEIAVATVARPTVGVDTPEDLARVEKMLGLKA